MKGELTAQRRSLCTLTGMAIGFRAFYAVIVDGGQLYGSGWIAMLIGLVLAVPAAAAPTAIRRGQQNLTAEGALAWAAGKWGARLVGILLFAVLVYDAGASIHIMSSTARYVAMPETNRNVIKAVTALTALAAAMMGTAAAAGAAVLWRRLAAVLMVILVLTQASYFRTAWLSPLFGPGVAALTESALPAAGIFSFAAAGWLMMEPEHDRKGGAILKTLIRSGLTAAALAMMFCMLVPGMMEEPPTRTFRLGRMLANDRAGLSLEMPYVVLIYSGMLTMLLFEMTAAAKALQIALPSVKTRVCVIAAGVLAFGLSLSGAAERQAVEMISAWYYPVIVIPMSAVGIAALIRGGREKKQAAKEGKA